jgi:nicotinamide phosphoribosyltransferase
MGTKEDEISTFKRLLGLYPAGILSVVSDTWDLWKVLTEYLPAIKSEIMARDGKLVIRPDSGDPVDIICGTAHEMENLNESTFASLPGFLHRKGDKFYKFEYDRRNRELIQTTDIKPEHKGVIELLWDIFGGTTVKGNDGNTYKVLDSHIGAIYGDSITTERAKAICERLKAKGFASTNVVFGIGSYTYQHNTRDTFGFAMKATYGEITHTQSCENTEQCTKSEGYCEFECGEPKQVVEPREIFKDPITDDGTKKSKKGLLRVVQHEKLEVVDQQTWAGEQASLLKTVFKDGKLVKTTTLEEIRQKLTV